MRRLSTDLPNFPCTPEDLRARNAALTEGVDRPGSIFASTSNLSLRGDKKQMITQDELAEVSAPGSRYVRRLSDHILVAFHQACDQGEIEVASALIEVLERIAMRPCDPRDGKERRLRESLVAA